MSWKAPLGLPVRGTDGQQRQQRNRGSGRSPLYSSDNWLSLVYFYQVLVIADRVPVIAAFLVGRQPSVVDRPENVVGLQEKPRKGVEERQPQPALGEMIRVAEAAGDPDILQDIIFGRVAQEGFVVVDDLTVDPVDVLRTPGTGLAQPQLLDARLFIAGIDFAAASIAALSVRSKSPGIASPPRTEEEQTNREKEYEGKLFHSSKISRPAVPGKTARGLSSGRQPAFPDLHVQVYEIRPDFCNFSSAFSTVQAAIRDKPADREGHLFRRRQNHCPRDAGLAGKMPVAGDDGQRSPIPCNGAGKDTEAGGEKARKGKTGRAQRDREAGTDETEYPRGIFSDQRFALA